MGEGKIAIEISPCSSMKSERFSSCSDDEGTPIRPIICVKKQADIKHFEEIDDCFVLDFDPFESAIEISKLSISKNLDASDLAVIAEKGQVACRDYPHARHLCVKFPFEKTSHESYCDLCYCYVCDSVAPCEFWRGSNGHCDASEHGGDWKTQRKLKKPIHWVPKFTNH